MKGAEPSVRGLGECGGHVWAPALDKGADPIVRLQPGVRGLGECGGHVWAPALNKGADPIVRLQPVARGADPVSATPA
jgi:hypothetical protein